MISIMTRSGGSPLSASSRRKTCRKPGLRNWRAETFTPMYGSSPPAAACHSHAARNPVANTHSPIAVMSPDSSATSMNWSGGRSPRTGCCQRSNASNPTTRPSPSPMIGWYSRRNSSSAIARSNAARSSSRAISVVLIHGSYRRHCRLPAPLAAYNAMSALRSRSWAVSASAVVATPTLAAQTISSSPIRTGRARIVISRPAAASTLS